MILGSDDGDARRPLVEDVTLDFTVCGYLKVVWRRMVLVRMDSLLCDFFVKTCILVYTSVVYHLDLPWCPCHVAVLTPGGVIYDGTVQCLGGIVCWCAVPSFRVSFSTTTLLVLSMVCNVCWCPNPSFRVYFGLTTCPSNKL
jgi:hypothetical protein